MLVLAVRRLGIGQRKSPTVGAVGLERSGATCEFRILRAEGEARKPVGGG
jgi:hypothetical protein